MLAKRINSCRRCGSKNLKSFIDFGDQVLTTMFPKKNQKNQRKTKKNQTKIKKQKEQK